MFRRVCIGFLKDVISTKTKALEIHSLCDRRLIFQSKDKFASYASGELWKSNVSARRLNDDSRVEADITSENKETLTSPFASSKNVENTDFAEKIASKIESGSNCIFMRGLPYSTTTDDIIKFFSPLGISPMKITLKQDRFGITNGKAEVVFETAEERSKALKKQNHYIGKRYIELSLSPFPQMNAERGNFQNQGARYSENPFAKDFPRNVVKLNGIPYSTTSDDIHKFFQPLNIVPIAVDLKYSPDGYPLGFCYVTFKTHTDAIEALKNNNKYIGDRYVRMFLMGSAQGRMPYSGVAYDKVNVRNPDEM